MTRNHASFIKHHKPYFKVPQRALGKVWFKEAKNDIKAANVLLKCEAKLFHLVCFSCQQAAEKALKAVQFFEDGNNVSFSHSLKTEASKHNPVLKRAVDELEILVVGYNRMRYPSKKDFPKGPSDMYSKGDAEKALELATNIVANMPVFLCSFCGDTLKTMTGLKQHEDRHRKTGTYECTECGFHSFSPANHQRHLQTHTKEREFKCDNCDKKLYSKKDLKRHKEREEGKSKKHLCDNCGKSFEDLTSLKDHMHSHTGEKSYRCSLCNKTFGYRSSLSRHKKNH